VADEPPGGYPIGCETRYPEKRDKILAAIFSLILSDFDHVVKSRFPILPRRILIDVRQNSASVCAGFALGGGHIQRKGVILRLLGVKGRRE
jgi:hypothetical protein